MVRDSRGRTRLGSDHLDRTPLCLSIKRLVPKDMFLVVVMNRTTAEGLELTRDHDECVSV